MVVGISSPFNDALVLTFVVVGWNPAYDNMCKILKNYFRMTRLEVHKPV